MDPVSHAMLGATCATLLCRRKEYLPVAAFCGGMAALFPDLDIIIRSENNPLLSLKYHRHFTHALVFIPLGAAIVSAIAWLIFRASHTYRRLFIFSLCGIATHGMLDSMTNYGTHFFWPFTERRESWSIISVVDPIFTFTLMGLLIAALCTRARKFVAISALFALSYWSFGYIQRESATAQMLQIANARGHVVEHSEVKPSLGNLFVWRMQYRYQQRAYIDAVHLSPWAGVVHYPGGSIALVDAASPVDASFAGELQSRDLAYFRFFSDGWIASVPGDESLIGDVRFSMLPNGIQPLWGIRGKPQNSNQHVTFENVNLRTPQGIIMLWSMIKGEPPAPLSLPQDPS